FLFGVFHRGHVGHPDRRALLGVDDDLRELTDGFGAPRGAQHELRVTLRDPAAGHLDVVGDDRVTNLTDAEAVRGELLDVDFDVDLPRPAAGDGHFSDA